jgi:hypothetical protein
MPDKPVNGISNTQMISMKDISSAITVHLEVKRMEKAIPRS